MNPEKVTYNLLQNSAALTALVSTRIYGGGLAPQGASLPYITYQRVASEHVHHHGGISGLTGATVQVSCVSRDYSELKSVADAARLAMHKKNGTIATIAVSDIAYNGESDATDTPGSGEENAVHRALLDFVVWTEEPTS